MGGTCPPMPPLGYATEGKGLDRGEVGEKGRGLDKKVWESREGGKEREGREGRKDREG